VAAFVLQMAFVGIYQADRLIIGSVLGPEQNATYSVAARFFLLVYGGFMMLMTPLWPAYGDALRRGDLSWVRRGVRLALTLGCGGMLVCGLVLLVAGDWIFHSWTRDKGINISTSLILALTATFVLRAWVDSRTTVLNSVAQFRSQAVFFVAHAVLNLVLALALAKPFGLEGVAWATPISALLTSAWGYPWLMRRYMAAHPASRGGGSGAAGAAEAAR
jgi:O-antigen/teichoic acid export membrane protein